MIAEQTRNSPLSGREQQLLKLAEEGYIDSAIAHSLGISTATVGTYWGRIRSKMGPFRRTELVGIKLKAEAEATLQGLRADNERLATQVRAKTIDVSDPNLYLRLLQNASDAVIVVDREGTIEFANDAACDLFGYSVDQLLARHINMLVPKPCGSKNGGDISLYLLARDNRCMKQHLHALACRCDGSQFPIAVALSVTKLGVNEHVMCNIRESSDQ